MHFYDKSLILYLFKTLDDFDLPYLLLRNTNDELPDRLPYGKDVDILVQHSNNEKFKSLLLKNEFKQIRHPFGKDKRLYGVHEFNKYQFRDSLLLDINYEMVVRSLDKGQWVPLDQSMQISAWENRILVDIHGLRVPMLCEEDDWIFTLARCIFDKKLFSAWHQNFLSTSLQSINLHTVMPKLHSIFFKFSPRLVQLVQQEKYDMIISEYIAFSDY